jgi:hypothetical protein
LASSFFTTPRLTPLPATALYFSASDTFSVAWVTIGRKVRPSGSRVFSAKKLVTEVSPPVRIFFASLTLMALTALVSSVFDWGTAASAARFMAVTSSSTFCPWPSVRSSLAALSSAPGSGMRTCGLPRKPSGLPSRLTAEAAPRSSAALRPALASASLRLSA